MRAILSTLFICMLLIPVYPNSNANYRISDLSVVKTGKDLRISFRLAIKPKATRSGYKLTIIPVLQGNNIRQELTPVEVIERKSRIIDYRKKLSHAKQNREPKKFLFKATNGDDIQYYTSIPFESWMSKGSLSVYALSQGCCKTLILPTDTLLSSINLSQSLTPRFSSKDMSSIAQIQGEELKKWDFGKNSPQISFPQGCTEIKMDYLSNKESLTEINKAINLIANAPNSLFKMIEISGFASPEGNSAQNYELSSNRAIALKNYIQQQIPELEDNHFRLVNGHENWSELRKLIEMSKMPQKKDILSIMDTTKSSGNLKERLMNYQGGYAYMYMVHNFFPLLRNACSLSIFYIKPESYQNATVAEIISNMKNKKYTEALPLLLNEKDDPLIWNALGVCYMMTNNWEEAKIYFRKAIEKGSSDAIFNLEMIE